MIEPFRIDIDDAALGDLKTRLARTRLPDEIDDAGWDYGLPRAVLVDFIDYWQRQLRLASMGGSGSTPSITSRRDLPDVLGDARLHFIHQRSRHDDAFPLVVTHGWPGSIVEFYKIIGPLTDPTAHGGKAERRLPRRLPLDPGLWLLRRRRGLAASTFAVSARRSSR